MKLFLKLFITISILGSQNLWAWYDHTTLLYWISKNSAPMFPDFKTGPKTKPELKKQIDEYENYAALLLLNPNAKLKSYDAKTWEQLITLAAEDPDHGIDKDLPDSADPSNDRKWMGGINHPGSQGFRHMVFQGFKINKPLSTLQFPFRSLGQGHDRFDLMANEAKKRIKEKDYWWGMRLLGWSLHYIQDLTQPFHTVQTPSMRMIPWSRVFTFNPFQIFNRYLVESDRTITNYHWAYEGFLRSELQKKDNSIFAKCFQDESQSILAKDPRDLALQVANESIQTSRELGNAIVDFFGTELQDPEINFPKGMGMEKLNQDLSLKTDLKSKRARAKITSLTCSYLKRATSASVWVLNWAFHP